MNLLISLNFSLNTCEERLAHLSHQLENTPYAPRKTELELFATYLLYGKDADGTTGFTRKELVPTHQKYSTYARRAAESLDALIESPAFDPNALFPLGRRQPYTRPPQILDPSLPGMADLRAGIAQLERRIAEHDDPTTSTYALHHLLVEMRREQYYLQDLFRPTIHFLHTRAPAPQSIDWSSDAAYWATPGEFARKMARTYTPGVPKDPTAYPQITTPDGRQFIRITVREHTFDWENPTHIAHLLKYYSDLYMELYEMTDSWGRTLIFDFDRYFDMARFSPLEEHIVTRKIDGFTDEQIFDELIQNGIFTYSLGRIHRLYRVKVPKRMAIAARAHRLLLETPRDQRKLCPRCGRTLPLDPIFFVKNASHADGFSSSCKRCETEARRAARENQFVPEVTPNAR